MASPARRNRIVEECAGHAIFLPTEDGAKQQDDTSNHTDRDQGDNGQDDQMPHRSEDSASEVSEEDARWKIYHRQESRTVRTGIAESVRDCAGRNR